MKIREAQRKQILDELESLLNFFRTVYKRDFRVYAVRELRRVLPLQVDTEELELQAARLINSLYCAGLLDYSDNLVTGGYRKYIRRDQHEPTIAERMNLLFRSHLRNVDDTIQWFKPAFESNYETAIIKKKDDYISLATIRARTREEIEESLNVLTIDSRLSYTAATDPSIREMIRPLSRLNKIYLMTSERELEALRAHIRQAQLSSLVGKTRAAVLYQKDEYDYTFTLRSLE